MGGEGQHMYLPLTGRPPEVNPVLFALPCQHRQIHQGVPGAGKTGTLDIPLKSPKHRRRLGRPAHVSRTHQQTAKENGQRDEAGEPEQTCQSIQTQNGELVGETG